MRSERCDEDRTVCMGYVRGSEKESGEQSGMLPDVYLEGVRRPASGGLDEVRWDTLEGEGGCSAAAHGVSQDRGREESM